MSADKIIQRHIDRKEFEKAIKYLSCLELIPILNKLIVTPTDEHQKLDIHYNVECSELNTFMKNHNASNSPIKFDRPYHTNYTNYIETIVDMEKKTITHVISSNYDTKF
jgi:hypothetical protein